MLIDTHIFAWLILNDPKLTNDIRKIIEDLPICFLSAICFFEVGQKVRIGKWPEMSPWLNKLPNIAQESGIEVIPVDAETCVYASSMKWDHRDPFDRIISATAIINKLKLISADEAFDSFTKIERIGL